MTTIDEQAPDMTVTQESVASGVHDEPGHRYLSQPGRIREDRRFVTGSGCYVADITPPGTLQVGLVTSPHPHARIVSIDTEEALKIPGVVAVVTGAELAAETNPLRQYLDVPEVQWRPLAVESTRYAGEWIAAVVADSRAIAEDGAEVVVVDYEPLPFVMDPEHAAQDEAPLVHPSHGTNVMAQRRFVWGDVDADRARAGRSTTVTTRWNRNSTVPLETFGAVAQWDQHRDVLDVWASIQMPQFPDQVAEALRIPSNSVRVHFDVDVGGSYGVKRGIKHGVLAGFLARRLGVPVKLIEDRSENMHGGDFHGPDRLFEVELWYTADGEFTTIRIDVLDDEGAYPGRSPLQLAKPIGAIVGPYRIPSAAYNATAVTTNKTGQVAVRGFGQSPTNYAIEAAVDAVARDLGVDRLELRRRNFIGPDEFPYRIPSGTEYDSGDYPGVLDKAIEISDLTSLLAERDDLRAQGRLAGIGFAACLEYQGTASFRERDDVAHRAVIDARGREQKGSGSANALITAELKPAEGGTLVDVATELNVSGRAAQFGRSLLAEVSNTMVDEFVRRLEVMIGGGDDSPSVSGPEPSAGGSGSGVTGSAALAQDDLDVVRTIALPMLRKGLPAIAAALIAGLIGMVVGRRQRRVAGPGRIPVTYVLPYPEGRERASFLP
ncbi:molybdopterin cofactor-binding domain-containing protein [Aeromicrobium piscarium]|uniref:Molybdopterin-dependent oxidoreductase n=1 Tax=Aeromicrobium piscarium TaxID=2590901 RepID=A0A554SGM8_9ACTN|nr:molybdopterin cofactor-binding domain-containing protein [Aeromicrobium piscarium]TSD65500.1 molybdopterin-dependent oxidoreductase [Aeromicrobium piscarium]